MRKGRFTRVCSELVTAERAIKFVTLLPKRSASGQRGPYLIGA
jgi:hypothetical protein